MKTPNDKKHAVGLSGLGVGLEVYTILICHTPYHCCRLFIRKLNWFIALNAVKPIKFNANRILAFWAKP